jgi:hypothetical protein
VTGIYVRIERDGRWQDLEIEALADPELESFFSGQDCESWAISLVKWIRDNVREGGEA